MSKTRQDSWNDQDDQILVRTVLLYIKEGKTQLLAFEDVGEQLHRTQAACGFRWNSFLRKQYNVEFLEAKRIKQTRRGLIENKEISKIGIDDVIMSLKRFQEAFKIMNSELISLRKEKESSDSKIMESDTSKMFKALSKLLKEQDNEKEMPTG
jgi:prespore-specific regulator